MDGIFVAPFGELAEPALVADLAARAEDRGWDGFFVWDHVAYAEPVRRVADPWIMLAAIAVATERVRIGPMVTPLARRRPHQLARETVTLDRLSGGRLIFGVGLGSDSTGEFDPARFGEEGAARERARLLDEGLEKLTGYWDGGFEPGPVDRDPGLGRVDAGRTASRSSARRATTACSRSTCPSPRRSPSCAARCSRCARTRTRRSSIVVENPPGADPAAVARPRAPPGA